MRPLSLLVGAIVFALTLSDALANTRVAFLEMRDRDGQILQLEPGGRFAHVAIKLRGEWLHAIPDDGVILTDSLASVGKIVEILQSPNDFNEGQAYSEMGKFYDRFFVWEDENSSYCSKLVAKLLGIPPVPMHFAGPFWSRPENLPIAQQGEGKPGISPDGLYRALLARGFHSD